MTDLEERVEVLEETVQKILQALDSALDHEKEDPLAAGFARFMARSQEERRGER